MVSVSSEFKLHWGSPAVLKYFFEFICNWSVKKNKIQSHGNNNSYNEKGSRKTKPVSVLVHSAFRFNHWRQDVLSPVPSPYPSVDKEIETTSGYWTWALKDVHRGRPFAFHFIPNIRMILGTSCDLSCSSSCWLIMIKSTF